MDLPAIAAEMVADGLEAVFNEATEELPSDRIDVELEVTDFNEPLFMQVTQIDVDSEAMPEVEMYQIWVGIPEPLTPDALADAISRLPALNILTPLIGFNVNVEENFGYFRHVGLAPESKPGRVMTEAVWLAAFAIEHFAGVLVYGMDEDDEDEGLDGDED
jgi:hypothetical protein